MEPAPQSQSPASRSLSHNARRLLGIVVPLAAGLALRMFMVHWLYEANGDSLVYGGIAKNLILHGRYALTTGSGEVYPTLIRLPGYPLFLALAFRLFGIENYYAAACLQIPIDLAGCLLLAGFVRRIVPPRFQSGAAGATLWLAALCPFTASYTAFPLSETLSLFALSLALWSMACFRDHPRWKYALWFTFAVCFAALLRPDGALAAAAFAPALIFGHPSSKIAPAKLARMALVCIALVLIPFAAWTWRNWRTFHVFQPLAPRLATDPDEAPTPGWESWVKSWSLDFITTDEIYWNVPGDVLDVAALPSRAFDSPAQYAETRTLADDYNAGNYEITPAIDARFAQLARQRIAAHPMRYYLWLPLGRVADMWLRPRIENLPIDLDWWVYRHHMAETRFGWSWAALNAIYLLLAFAGLCMRPRYSAALAAYMLLRSALLLTIEAPEARYTLECFPMLFVLGGVALYRLIYVVFLSAAKVKASFGKA